MSLKITPILQGASVHTRLPRRLSSPDYIAKLAVDPKTHEDAYRLRYESYLTSGYIEPNESGRFVDDYDGMANSRTVVIYRDDVPLASVRVSFLVSGSDLRSPGADTFPEAVNRILKDASFSPSGPGRGLELTRLVRSPEAQNNQGLVFLLYRIAGYLGMMSHAQVGFACVRKNHVSFYKRLGYQPETELRPYPGLNCPMQLMSSNRQRYDEIRASFPLIDPFTSATDGLEDLLSGGNVALWLRGAA